MADHEDQTHNFTDLRATQAWATSMLRQFQRPCVVLLNGDLGAGKTQLVRWWLQGLQATDVASPTFAIHHSYDTPSGKVDHVDLYRVKDDADLESSGFWDLFSSADGLVLVEWADRLPDNVWPHDWLRLKIELRKSATEEGREISIKRLPDRF
jgi:tRNA threonylcarbamoyladenosine biosynthesis protein TsaE